MVKYNINYSVKILSYNIYYKSMLGIDKNFEPQSKAQNNVKNIIKSGDYDIIGLQEAQCIEKIFDKRTLDKYNYIESKSGEDIVVTFLKKKFKIINYLNTEFCNGRPLQIIKVNFNNDIIIIVNLHAPHHYQNFGNYQGVTNKSNKDYSSELIRIINNKINLFINNTKIDRIILLGDFNEIFNRIDTFKFKLNINKKIFEMKTDRNKKLSCCYRNFDKTSDYIFDSITEPKLLITSTIHPASDHYPIEATI